MVVSSPVALDTAERNTTRGPRSLSRFASAGAFGSDCSALGLGPGGWVDFRRQSEIYATGRVALNIMDGHDEEGLTLKPFEIAASGVPLLQYAARGLEELYEPGHEVTVFQRPRQALDLLRGLLADRERRVALAAAARGRTLADHTWDRRIERMLQLARLPIDAFRITPTAAAE